MSTYHVPYEIIIGVADILLTECLHPKTGRQGNTKSGIRLALTGLLLSDRHVANYIHGFRDVLNKKFPQKKEVFYKDYRGRDVLVMSKTDPVTENLQGKQSLKKFKDDELQCHVIKKYNDGKSVYEYHSGHDSSDPTRLHRFSSDEIKGDVCKYWGGYSLELIMNNFSIKFQYHEEMIPTNIQISVRTHTFRLSNPESVEVFRDWESKWIYLLIIVLHIYFGGIDKWKKTSIPDFFIKLYNRIKRLYGTSNELRKYVEKCNDYLKKYEELLEEYQSSKK